LPIHLEEIILTPTDRTPTDAVKRVTEFWEALGGRVTSMDPATHDRAVAAISHLPHLVVDALVAAVGDMDPRFLDVAARGFKDTTRIAASDPVVWREIFQQNREALGEALAAFRRALGSLERLLESGDDAAIEAALERIRRTGTRYRLTAAEIVNLHNAGVSFSVVLATPHAQVSGDAAAGRPSDGCPAPSGVGDGSPDSSAGDVTPVTDSPTLAFPAHESRSCGIRASALRPPLPTAAQSAAAASIQNIAGARNIRVCLIRFFVSDAIQGGVSMQLTPVRPVMRPPPN
jgi:hypothetical protein